MTQVVRRGFGAIDAVDDGPVTPELPAGLENRDLMVAVIHGSNSRAVTWSSSGWTAVAGFSAVDPYLTDTFNNYALLWKQAGPSETDPTFTPNSDAGDPNQYATIAAVFAYSGEPLGGTIPDLTTASGSFPGGTVATADESMAIGFVWTRLVQAFTGTTGWDLINWYATNQYVEISQDATAGVSDTFPTRTSSTNSAWVKFCVAPPPRRHLDGKVGML